MLFLAAEGLNVLLREKPGQWVRRFAYPALLILYVFVSAVFVGRCFSLEMFTLGMNIALAVLIAGAPQPAQGAGLVASPVELRRRSLLYGLLPEFP